MKTSDLAQVRGTLWKAADELRANSTLSPSEARGPILGLIFLAYAEHRFKALRPELEAKATARNPVTPDDYRAGWQPEHATHANLYHRGRWLHRWALIHTGPVAASASDFQHSVQSDPENDIGAR